MVVRNDLDRYRLVMDVIDRVPGLGVRAAACGRRWPTPAPPPRLDPRARHRPARGRRLDLGGLRRAAGIPRPRRRGRGGDRASSPVRPRSWRTAPEALPPRRAVQRLVPRPPRALVRVRSAAPVGRDVVGRGPARGPRLTGAGPLRRAPCAPRPARSSPPPCRSSLFTASSYRRSRPGSDPGGVPGVSPRTNPPVHQPGKGYAYPHDGAVTGGRPGGPCRSWADRVKRVRIAECRQPSEPGRGGGSERPRRHR